MAAHGKTIPQGDSFQGRYWAPVRAGLIAAGVASVIVATISPKVSGYVAHFQPHAPDFARIADAPLVIRVHLFAALTALAIGTVLMMRVKGANLHKLLGWTWVIAMGITAVSSLFIRTINPGHFSFIHLLSGWTIVGLPGAVYAIKRGKVGIHRRAMTGMFVGGLLLAGLFTFIPGRLLWAVFFG
jgi:uncharacterized membrane protein